MGGGFGSGCVDIGLVGGGLWILYGFGGRGVVVFDTYSCLDLSVVTHYEFKRHVILGLFVTVVLERRKIYPVCIRASCI